MTRRIPVVLAALGLAAGCNADTKADANDDGIDVPTTDPATGGSSGAASATGDDAAPDDDAGETSPGAGSSSSEGPEPEPPVVFDVSVPDAIQYDCGAPFPVVCDGASEDDPWRTIGLNCPGGPQVDGVYNGDPQSLMVHVGDLGTHVPAPYPPREGDAFVILSSGIANDLTIPGFFAAADINGFLDNAANLPAPLTPTPVDPLETCADDPGLVGSGDCSNTIEGQWNQGSGAFDYNELRFTVEVPFETYGFSYDFAMFSTEYPDYYQTVFNDMYIAWLESENWTGNISFDEMGNPISLNAGFLDYKDAPNPYDCPAPCNAPELAGTAMQGHAGTKWLTTTAGVTPFEEIEVVFAIFDLSDPILDTVVLLDNFHWACEGGPPVTIPG
jgi:hypothetical protein